jgi:hypothetical protein
VYDLSAEKFAGLPNLRSVKGGGRRRVPTLAVLTGRTVRITQRTLAATDRRALRTSCIPRIDAVLWCICRRSVRPQLPGGRRRYFPASPRIFP